jgi:hypothetical protein
MRRFSLGWREIPGVQRRVKTTWMALLFGLLFLFPVAFAEDRVSEPFKGVKIIERKLAGPPREAIYIAEIDLTAPGLRFTTTEPNGDGPRETWTETVLEFVVRKKAQLGINANFFIFDHKKDTDVRGLAYSEGKLVSPWESHEAALHISEKNEALIVHRATEDFKGTATEPKVELYNAVCGGMVLVEAGKSTAKTDGKRHPRTCVGLKPDRKLLLVVVDGRHPDHSEGMTHAELAELLISLGAVDGLELDGGGSATFVIADPTPRVVNVPMTANVPAGITIPPPGVMRKNGNNLAVFALPHTPAKN